MIRLGDIISYTEMTALEGCNLQRGMNYRLKGRETVILMSTRKGAPYADRVEENGRILIYEGHDASKRDGHPDVKKVDQPAKYPTGTLTSNGWFEESVKRYKEKKAKAEVVKVYEKIKAGIWVYNGRFHLIDAWQEKSNGRRVYKFKLELIEGEATAVSEPQDLKHDRMIPSEVKLAVWKRDKGQCVKCLSKDNLHFDHDLPFSKGGTSLMVENIQLLCARHNLQKSNKLI